LEIRRPDDLVDIANLGLTLSEAKRLLAGVQREIVAAQGRDHAVATLFGQVTLRLPRFRCAACGGIEAGFGWPSHCRSTPELDRLQAHLCALRPTGPPLTFWGRCSRSTPERIMKPCAAIP